MKLPSAPYSVRARASCTSAGGGVESAKITASITPMATGAPRLPQAMPRKATKVAPTMNTPSTTGSARSSCTARNSGMPISGAAIM